MKALTSIVLASSEDPANAGDTVTFTATVPPEEGGTPTGTVTFQDNGVLLGTVSLAASGTVSFTTSSLTANPYSITAVYGGDTNFTAAPAGSVNRDYQADCHDHPSYDLHGGCGWSGRDVSGGSSSGRLSQQRHADRHRDVQRQHHEPGYSSCGRQRHCDLHDQESLRWQYTLTASYSGDASYDNSSISFSQTVSPAATSTDLVSDVILVPGQPIDMIATVSVASPGGGTPTGTVTFSDGTASLGTAVVRRHCDLHDERSCRRHIHMFTASYSGDGNYDGSVSGTYPLTVDQDPPIDNLGHAGAHHVWHGPGAMQLDATGSVSGTLVYSSGAGTILERGG